jgi:hypothetical protein
MINPSVFGWIDKFFHELEHFEIPENDELFYNKLRQTGFIYGHIVELPFLNDFPISNWRSEEVSKIAFLSVLFEMYSFTSKNTNSVIFIEKAVTFYDEMQTKTSFNFNFGKQSNSQKLENIIALRVKTNKDIISKNFSPIVTNALLFIDVLAFGKFLSLSVKSVKSSNDKLLIKLFEASVRYTKFNNVTTFSDLADLPLNEISTSLEKYYLIDLAGLTLWSDGIVQHEERNFLINLASNLNVSTEFVADSCAAINLFIAKYKSEINYFKHTNPVKHFYDQTSSNVEVLVKRNQKRLTKELLESRELVHLLAQSTSRDLDKNEKKKVKKQLLDICKSIPSLTIFLLPGGGLLLPILIKFIPQLLPSAFNENLEN